MIYLNKMENNGHYGHQMVTPYNDHIDSLRVTIVTIMTIFSFPSLYMKKRKNIYI